MKNIKFLIFLILVTLTVSGCVSPRAKNFSIYLPAQEISVYEMSEVDINDLKLEDEPIISVWDIISFTWETHEIELTASAYERLTRLEVSLIGTPFVVCVGRDPVYWGAFWTPASSIPFNGVVIRIWNPFDTDKHVIKIQVGYPSSEWFTGEDPRSNPEILESLDRAGKLK